MKSKRHYPSLIRWPRLVRNHIGLRFAVAAKEGRLEIVAQTRAVPGTHVMDQRVRLTDVVHHQTLLQLVLLRGARREDSVVALTPRLPANIPSLTLRRVVRAVLQIHDIPKEQ